MFDGKSLTSNDAELNDYEHIIPALNTVIKYFYRLYTRTISSGRGQTYGGQIVGMFI